MLRLGVTLLINGPKCFHCTLCKPVINHRKAFVMATSALSFSHSTVTQHMRTEGNGANETQQYTAKMTKDWTE